MQNANDREELMRRGGVIEPPDPERWSFENSKIPLFDRPAQVNFDREAYTRAKADLEQKKLALIAKLERTADPRLRAEIEGELKGLRNLVWRDKNGFLHQLIISPLEAERKYQASLRTLESIRARIAQLENLLN
jgi:hypothetical protein